MTAARTEHFWISHKIASIIQLIDQYSRWKNLINSRVIKEKAIVTIWILLLRCILSNTYYNIGCLLKLWMSVRFYIPRVSTDGYQYSNTHENSHARMNMVQTRWIHIHLVLTKWPSSVSRLLLNKILCNAMINETGTMEPFTFSLILPVAGYRWLEIIYFLWI